MTTEIRGERVPRWMRAFALVAVGATLAFCWRRELFWGQWLDETFTSWQVERGWREIARSKLGNPGQSLLFGYIESLFYFPDSPHMEAWLRLPAIAGALMCCLLVFHLAESFVRKGAGLIALLPFVGNPQVINLACQARPYTLAMAACFSSLWALHRWLERGKVRHLFLFSVSVAIVPYLHFVYAVFGIVPMMLLGEHVRRGRRVDWFGFLCALGLIAVLLLPLAWHARDFIRHSDGLSYLPSPGWSRLLEAWIPGIAILSTLALLVVVGFVGWKPVTAASHHECLQLTLFWWLAPPFVLFLISRVTHQTILIERYYLYTAAAQGLLVAILFSDVPPVLAEVALLACFLPLAVLNGLNEGARQDGSLSWRSSLRTVRALDPAGEVPLFVQAGHPISNTMDWQHAPERRSFLYSQLVAYPVANRVYPVPFALDDATRSYVRSTADGVLADSATIFFAGAAGQPTVDWVRGFFEKVGYQSSYVIRQNICLLVLRRSEHKPTADHER